MVSFYMSTVGCAQRPVTSSPTQVSATSSRAGNINTIYSMEN